MLPFVLLMARVAGFILVSPIFGWRAVPVVVRAGVVVLITVFFAAILPPAFNPAGTNWLQAVVLIVQETTIGLALGLAARFIYSAVQQGMLIAAQQMGFADAGVIDPISGAQSRPIAALFEMLFAILFLSAGGHHILLVILGRSFNSFPVSAGVNVPALTEGIIRAGSAMLLFALRFGAPMLAGFLVMAVMLCILARVLPEMNILLASFPLRVGVGLFLAAAIMPSMNAFTIELARWMSKYLIA